LFYHRGVFHSVGIHIEFEIQNKYIKFIFALQKDVGHFSLNISLTYLIGLEITELKKEDMPKLSHIKLNYI